MQEAVLSFPNTLLFHFRDLERSFPPHFHECLTAGCIVNGERNLVTPDFATRLTPGDLIVIPALVPHACQHSGANGCEWICLHIKGDANFPANAQIFKSNDLCAQFAGIARQIRAGERIDPLEIDKLSAKITRLACGTAPSPLAPTPPQSRPASSKFSYLRAFKARMGITPGRYHNNLRLNIAQKDLAAGLPIADCATAAGFYDQSHFNRRFKQNMGVTPGQFRQAVLA